MVLVRVCCGVRAKCVSASCRLQGIFKSYGVKYRTCYDFWDNSLVSTPVSTTEWTAPLRTSIASLYIRLVSLSAYLRPYAVTAAVASLPQLLAHAAATAAAGPLAALLIVSSRQPPPPSPKTTARTYERVATSHGRWVWSGADDLAWASKSWRGQLAGFRGQVSLWEGGLFGRHMRSPEVIAALRPGADGAGGGVDEVREPCQWWFGKRGMGAGWFGVW